ncbi:hypothetical protein EI94DRAFT_1733967 [Lactarius quietus]|nr:hypothetical protein EI94DRAFT_1733967 [Lactarius quietus]
MIGKLYVLSLFYMIYVASISSALRWFTPFLTSRLLATLDLHNPHKPTSYLPRSYRRPLCELRLLNTQISDTRVGGDARNGTVFAECDV